MKANLYVERKQNYKAMSPIVFKCTWFILLILRFRRTQNEFCNNTRPCIAEHERTSQTYEKKKITLRLVCWCTFTIREFSRSPCGRTCTEVRALERLYFSGLSPSEGVEDGSHCRFGSILC